MKKRKLQPTKKSELITPSSKITPPPPPRTHLNKDSRLRRLFKASISRLAIHQHSPVKTGIWTRGMSGTFSQLIMGVVVLTLLVSCPGTNGGPVELGTVSGLSPADGASTTDTTPTFSWDAVPDATGYELRIADSEPGLTSASSVSETGTTHTPASALTNLQTYYWQVRAKDGAGQYGAWSEVQSLNVEWGAISGQSPADGSSTPDTTPTFSWDAVPDATGYELRIADSEPGLTNASSVSETGTTHTPASALTNLQTYYWQVRAKDGSGQYGAWSEIQSLNVEWGAISGQSPADGSSTPDTTPTFSWTAIPGAVEYELRIADSEPGLTNASSVSETGTTHTPASALTNLQTYYWQVRAKDGAGQYGTWSEVQSLNVEWGAISGQSPADGSSTPDTTPTFSWTAIPGAAGYDLQLADSRAGVEFAPVQNVTDTSYTPSSALTDKHTHYWRVQAKDGAGQSGPWSVIIAIQIGYSIGDTGPAGGIVFYDKGSYSDGWRYMAAAPSDQSTGIGIEWGGGFAINVGGTGTGIGSGKSNTESIVTRLGSGNYAAQLCSDFELGGYDDWFLPSKDELNELYTQKDTVGGFTSYNYWSSSEISFDTAWRQGLSDGIQFAGIKTLDLHVRAVRAF